MTRTGIFFVASFLVALTGTSLAAQVAEEEEPRTPEVPQLYAGHVKMSDVPLVARELNFDDGQTMILRQLFLDYLEIMDSNRTRSIELILDEASPTPKDDPEYRARAEHRNNIKRIRSDRRAEAVRSAVLQELDAMSDRDVPQSRRLNLIRSWQSTQADSYEYLIESMQSILEGTQPGHWPAIERALRRRNTPWGTLFTPETVNLGGLVYTYWGRNSDAAIQAYDAIAKYDQAYDEALVVRDAVLARVEPEWLDARDYRHPERMISTRQDAMDARVSMWRVNDEYIDVIAQAMGPDAGAEFREMALDTMYPDIYPTHRFEHAVEYALQYEDLSAVQIQKISDLSDRFHSRLVPLNETRVRLFRQSEPDRHMRGEEDGAMLMCYQSMGSGIGDMTKIIEFNSLNEKKRQLDEASRAELRVIIGGDRYDGWPGLATRPSVGDIARGPVPGADPDAPVVYMKDMMRPASTQAIPSNED